jgi:cellulose synthase (UDP-forming)
MAFATTLFGWFDSWRTFAFMVLPMMVVVSGASPINAPGWVYGPAFATVFVMQFLALRLLARGYYPPITSLLFEVLRMPAVLPATLAVFTSGRGATFKATPKGASEERSGTPVPWLLRLMLGGSAIALGWFIATIAGVTPTAYHQMPATVGAVGFLVMNMSLLVLAIRRIRDPRFAGDRRAGVRLDVRLFGVVNDTRCEIEDLSTTGAKVLLSTVTAFERDEASLGVILPDGRTLHLDCEVRRRIDREDGLELGLQFRAGQRATLGEISLALLHQRDDHTVTDEVPAAA